MLVYENWWCAKALSFDSFLNGLEDLRNEFEFEV